MASMQSACKLAEGRTFTEAEIQYTDNPTSSDFVPSVIITGTWRKALYGEEPALGKRVYDKLGQSAVVVGVIEHMLGAWVDWDTLTHVMFLSRIQTGPDRALCRARRAGPTRCADRRDRAQARRAPTSAARSPGCGRTATITERSYRADSRMVAFLSVIVGADDRW